MCRNTVNVLKKLVLKMSSYYAPSHRVGVYLLKNIAIF